MRYFICPIIGDGLTTETAWRAKIPQTIQSHSALIPSKPDGSPKFSWALVKIDAMDFTTILADTTIFAFPNKSLDSTLTTNERNKIKTILNSLKIQTLDILATTTLKQILLKVAQFLEPTIKTI